MGAAEKLLFNSELSDANNLLDCIEAALADDFTKIPTGTDTLSSAIAKLIEKMQKRTSANLSEVVNVSISVNETAVKSANLLYNLRRVDEESQAIATAAEEMATTVNEMAQSGEHIVTNARRAGEACESSKGALRQTGERMRVINDAVNQTGDRINTIQELANSISGIAGGIKKIASQTNMLAINAAVEAARAGDAGRGFAVVAAEVKALSDRTAAATVEISDIIGKLHSGLSGMVASMDQSRQSASEGNEALGVLENTLNSASTQIHDAIANVDQMAISLQQQRTASQGVAGGIATVASSASQATHELEQVMDAMDEAQAALTAQLTYLATCNVPGKIVKLAQSDHVIWKKRLANMIVGREGLNPNELADHHTCRLGKWYDGSKGQRIAMDPDFVALNDPHCQVHQHGIDAVRKYNSGDVAGALRELECVEVASGQVLNHLQRLERRSA